MSCISPLSYAERFLNLGMMYVLLLCFGFSLVGLYFMCVVTIDSDLSLSFLWLWYQDFASLVLFTAAVYPQKYSLFFAADHSVSVTLALSMTGRNFTLSV